MRHRIFQIIETSNGPDKASAVYDAIMGVVILVSLIPLAFKDTNTVFMIIDIAASGLFLLDYALRLWTADLKLRRGPISFVVYPFTPMAIIDLLAILPSFGLIASGFRLFKLFRLLRAARVLRVFRTLKLFRYSRSVEIIINVIKAQKTPLFAVCSLAVAYILVAALVIFNVEPDTFPTFFDAIYWAAVSLTTVGYGDIYPVSTAGRLVTIISAFVGIAVVALPSGIITAGYMDELRKYETDQIRKAPPEGEAEKR